MISTSAISATPNAKGVGYVYYQSMLKHRHKIAQIDGKTNEEQTFDALLKRSIRTAITMQNKGIKPGDFISICSLNHLDTCVPYIASLFIGAILTAVDTTMSIQEITQLLKQVSPKIIFVSYQSVNLIEKVAFELGNEPLIVVFGETNKHVPFSEFTIAYSDEYKFQPTEPKSLNETALVIFSSGTTGRPKGICHSHFSILSNNTLSQRYDFITVCSFCTIYWSVFHIFLHINVTKGFKRLILPPFNFDNPWNMLQFKIDYMFLTPLQCFALLKHKRPSNINLKNLGFLRVGGNFITKEKLEELKRRLPHTTVHNFYGQTEVFGTMVSFTDDSNNFANKYPTSIGLPVRGFCYKIVDIENEKILGPNQQGELRIKSNCQTTGYYNYDSSECFDSDGWLKTGDLAYYNEDKCFFITNRIKESFKYRSHHIIPVEIEEIVLTHPSVDNAIVFGLPHETDDNHPMAAVVLNGTNVGNVTPEEIVQYVEERVEDKNRLRGGVKVVDKIPLTASDKISRFKLIKMVLNNEL